MESHGIFMCTFIHQYLIRIGKQKQALYEFPSLSYSIPILFIIIDIYNDITRLTFYHHLYFRSAFSGRVPFARVPTAP